MIIASSCIQSRNWFSLFTLAVEELRLRQILNWRNQISQQSAIIVLEIYCKLYNYYMNDKPLTPLDLDSLINRLISEKKGNDVKMTQQEIKAVCHSAREIFLNQPILLELEAPIKIVGDIHGQFQDLLKIFDYGGFPPEKNYLFLGDYVDRGKQSIETIVLLLAYKIKYPQNFFLLRGNHQSAEINKLYGFYDQCKRKFSLKIWKFFTDCFNAMPIAAIIEQKILCMHGGISPQLPKIKKLLTLNRPTDIPSQGMLCDLLWADPVQEQRGWHQNKERGISYLFGADVLNQFLKANDLDLICRSHQIVEEGYQFFGKKQLVTIFSAPNYCGMFENWAAVLNVDQQLICSFHVIKPEVKGAKTGDPKKRPKTPKYIN